jgi:hypothetical protein
VHLVAIATGPGVLAPYCETPRPYQPSSKVFNPRVIGSTNPIWIDADADGRFTAARTYAEQVIAQTGTTPAKLLPALAATTMQWAVQAAALCQAGGTDIRTSDFAGSAGVGGRSSAKGFTAFGKTLEAK